MVGIWPDMTEIRKIGYTKFKNKFFILYISQLALPLSQNFRTIKV